uniref:Mytilin 2 n=1 Tax=Mytilus californianus TaxID=6549 RepID=A0A6B9XQD5_MYTCA|nr:mytilin 2 [Mytilus californianus]
MKLAVILAIGLAVLLIVQDADASCASRCKSRCRARRCKYYVSVRYGWFCYCRCLRCASEHTMKFSSENEGQSEMSAQMNDHENTDQFQDMQKGETEQGETGM